MGLPPIHALRRPDPLCDLVIDRAAEWRDDAAWVAAREHAPDTCFVVLDAERRLLVDPANGEPRWLNVAERAAHVADAAASLLGVADGRAWFLLRADAHDGLPAESGAWIDLRRAVATLDAFAVGLFTYARGLAYWQDLTRFCGVCGAPLVRTSAGHRARCTNPECARLHFPRTDAAIITIVEHDGACLLGRQASWPEGRYSTLAGFVEPGETLEAAVRREVFEEAGIEVAACQYHSSQPWPFPASLMVGFTATARTRQITLRDGELQDARWFAPQEIVDGIRNRSLLPSTRVSVSWRLLADWLHARAGIDLASVVPIVA